MLTKYPVPNVDGMHKHDGTCISAKSPICEEKYLVSLEYFANVIETFRNVASTDCYWPKKECLHVSLTPFPHVFLMTWDDMSIFPPENLLSSTWQGWSVESCRRLIHPAGNNNKNNWIWARENIRMKQASAWLQSPPQVVSHWSNPHSSAFQTRIFMLRWCISFHTIALFHLLQFLSRTSSDKKHSNKHRQKHPFPFASSRWTIAGHRR